MTMPVPVTSSPPQPVTQAATYVHDVWMDDWARTINGHLVPMWQDLRIMEMCLTEQRAGRTQLRLVRECLAFAADFLMFAVTFVKRTDERFTPLFDAIDQAGGIDEVAKAKTYHDPTA